MASPPPPGPPPPRTQRPPDHAPTHPPPPPHSPHPPPPTPQPPQTPPLHPPPHTPPLTYPSHKYDALRHTIVHAELILLRALAFGIHQSPVAYEYLPRLVSKILNTKTYGGDLYSPAVGGMEDWDTYT